MSALTLLIVCSLVAVGAMITVTYANQREKKARLLRQRLKYLRLRTDDLEELVIELGMLVESKAIAQRVNDEIIDLLNDMLKLDPSATYLSASLANAELRMEQLGDESRDTPLDRLRESDVKIARAQHQLNEASKALRRQQQNGKLSMEEYSLFIFQLSWAHLMVSVISYIGQGHRAMNRGDVLSAHAFYKRAQQTLIQSSHSDPRRHRMIKEISEMLQSKRRFLSTDLMPETQYNPEGADPVSISTGDSTDATLP